MMVIKKNYTNDLNVASTELPQNFFLWKLPVLFQIDLFLVGV